VTEEALQGSRIIEMQPESSKVIEPLAEEPVVEETVTESDTETVTEEAEEPSREFSYDDYLREQARANGLHRQVTALRGQHRELREEMQQQSKLMEDALAAFRENQQPEEFADDPAAQYFKERLESEVAPLKEKLRIQEEAQATQSAANAEINEVMQYGAQSAAAFRAREPKWQEAYQFARQKFAEANGVAGDDQRINVIEVEMTKQWMDQGIDPASAIWDFARQNGFSGTAVPQTKEVPQQVRRVRAGISQTQMGDVEGDPPESRSGTLSAQQFMDRYDSAYRRALFMRNPDAFEELQKTGRISTFRLK
jgi:hypothetical protein